MTPESLTQPAFWPLSIIVFLPALVAAFLSLPIIPKGKEESVRWIALMTMAVVFLLSLDGGALAVWGHGTWPVCCG